MVNISDMVSFFTNLHRHELIDWSFLKSFAGLDFDLQPVLIFSNDVLLSQLERLGRGGEIGIRARLRISWSKDCAGSNPALGTIKKIVLGLARVNENFL